MQLMEQPASSTYGTCRHPSPPSSARPTATPPAAIFTIAAVTALVSLITLLFIREVPLRRTVRKTDSPLNAEA